MKTSILGTKIPPLMLLVETTLLLGLTKKTFLPVVSMKKTL